MTVNGEPGVWLEEPHLVFFEDLRGRVRQSTGRLAGKTLLWQHGDVTLRLEGDLSKEEALRIARTGRLGCLPDVQGTLGRTRFRAARSRLHGR